MHTIRPIKDYITHLQTKDDISIERVLRRAVVPLLPVVVLLPIFRFVGPLTAFVSFLPLPCLALSPLYALPGRDPSVDAVNVIRIHGPELSKRRLPARGWVQSADLMTQLALDTKDEDWRATDNPVLIHAKRGQRQQVVVLADEVPEGSASCTK